MDLLCELFKTVHNDDIYFEDKGSALKRKGKKGKKRKNHKAAERGWKPRDNQHCFAASWNGNADTLSPATWRHELTNNSGLENRLGMKQNRIHFLNNSTTTDRSRNKVAKARIPLLAKPMQRSTLSLLTPPAIFESLFFFKTRIKR
jgi:hypothetical protein